MAPKYKKVPSPGRHSLGCPATKGSQKGINLWASSGVLGQSRLAHRPADSPPVPLDVQHRRAGRGSLAARLRKWRSAVMDCLPDLMEFEGHGGQSGVGSPGAGTGRWSSRLGGSTEDSFAVDKL